jgi:predicted MFS family arabinose efflux permease
LLASRWGWQMPFISIALLSSVLAVAAAWTMPPLRDHLGGPERPSVWQGIAQVLKDRNHLNALGFSALMMFTGFTIIPYFTIYLEANVGLVSQQIPYVYLCGGIATLFTARLIGRLADRLGKARVFRWLAVGLIVPMLLMSSMRPMHIGWVLVVSTLLFVFLSGRMIPGMALLTGAANPALRGTFMAFNSAVQSAAMGTASIVGGLVIGRDAAGQMTFYWAAALVGATASLLSLWFLRRLKVHDSAGVTRVQG